MESLYVLRYAIVYPMRYIQIRTEVRYEEHKTTNRKANPEEPTAGSIQNSESKDPQGAATAPQRSSRAGAPRNPHDRLGSPSLESLGNRLPRQNSLPHLRGRESRALHIPSNPPPNNLSSPHPPLHEIKSQTPPRRPPSLVSGKIEFLWPHSLKTRALRSHSQAARALSAPVSAAR